MPKKNCVFQFSTLLLLSTERASNVFTLFLLTLDRVPNFFALLLLSLDQFVVLLDLAPDFLRFRSGLYVVLEDPQPALAYHLRDILDSYPCPLDLHLILIHPYCFLRSVTGISEFLVVRAMTLHIFHARMSQVEDRLPVDELRADFNTCFAGQAMGWAFALCIDLGRGQFVRAPATPSFGLDREQHPWPSASPLRVYLLILGPALGLWQFKKSLSGRKILFVGVQSA